MQSRTRFLLRSLMDDLRNECCSKGVGMKKILVLLVVSLCLTHTVHAVTYQDGIDEGLYTYERLANNCLRIVEYHGHLPDEDLVVPEVIAGRTVTEIGSEAFNGTYLRSIVIPATVKYIGRSAFGVHNGSTFLAIEEVTILGDQVTIEETAFYSCESLVRVECKGSIKYIGENAFNGCIRLKEFVAPSIGTIGTSAFAKCKSLSGEFFCGLTDNTVIGDGAFASCTSINGLVIPKNVTKIGKNAFNRCKATIMVYPGSYAEKYALENNISYSLINEETE